MTDQMILRRRWAIQLYKWLKENDIVLRIESGVDILVNDEQAMLTIDEDDSFYPKEFKDASLFFISETKGVLNVELLRERGLSDKDNFPIWNPYFTLKNTNN